jgi:hypothetical protein
MRERTLYGKKLSYEVFLSSLDKPYKWTHKNELCFKPKSKYKSTQKRAEDVVCQ